MIRKILPLLLITACSTTRQIPRQDWGAANNAGGKLEVRMRDGTRLNLSRYSFTTAGLVASDGTSRSARGAKTEVHEGTLIHYDSIDVVKVKELDKAKTMLAFAAVIGAGYAIVGGSSDNKKPEAQPRPVTTSCPFIYSFNGKDWRMDSETYAGAIARGLERSDVDNLDQIRSVDGMYKIALVNEADEVEYTDELSLIVAEHPKGSLVYPDTRGILHTVSAESQRVALRRIAVASLPAKTRWEATFANPQNRKLALVLTLRNTEALPFIHLHMLNLLGDSVYSWYRMVNTNPVSAARVARWYESMAGLRVTARTDGSGWRDQDIVQIVGPKISKTIVVPLNVDPAQKIVTIRLESSPMLWNIESAVVAEELPPAGAREVQVSRAVDSDGNDVTSSLQKRDGAYHIAATGSRVVAEFAATEPREGMVNTVIARTTGHYYTTSTDDRRGNPALVSRLMRRSAINQGYFMLKYRQAGRQAGSE